MTRTQMETRRSCRLLRRMTQTASSMNPRIQMTMLTIRMGSLMFQMILMMMIQTTSWTHQEKMIRMANLTPQMHPGMTTRKASRTLQVMMIQMASSMYQSSSTLMNFLHQDFHRLDLDYLKETSPQSLLHQALAMIQMERRTYHCQMILMTTKKTQTVSFRHPIRDCSTGTGFQSYLLHQVQDCRTASSPRPIRD